MHTEKEQERRSRARHETNCSACPQTKELQQKEKHYELTRVVKSWTLYFAAETFFTTTNLTSTDALVCNTPPIAVTICSILTWNKIKNIGTYSIIHVIIGEGRTWKLRFGLPTIFWIKRERGWNEPLTLEQKEKKRKKRAHDHTRLKMYINIVYNRWTKKKKLAIILV